jgi:geranylgeranyl diphosphate synthase, type I
VKIPETSLEVGALVISRLQSVLEEETRRWGSVDPDLGDALESIAATVLAGGKRLRPAFCYWAFVGAGGDPGDPSVVDAGAALEMLHCAALIHDDVIDGSRVRHDADALQVGFEGRHRARGWRGDPARFGDNAAILMGDLAFAYAARLLPSGPVEVRRLFEEMCLEVNVGQYLDLLGAAEGVDLPEGLAIERAARICRYKTAKYTIERPLHLGAALARPSGLAALQESLSAFALPLGEAFQLRDDLLGVFGDPAVTGKPVGEDLREGKATLLASVAVASLGSDAAGRFVERFGSEHLDDAGVSLLQSLIVESGSRARVEATIETLLEESLAALDRLPLLPPGLSALRDLAGFTAGRSY